MPNPADVMAWVLLVLVAVSAVMVGVFVWILCREGAMVARFEEQEQAEQPTAEESYSVVTARVDHGPAAGSYVARLTTRGATVMACAGTHEEAVAAAMIGLDRQWRQRVAEAHAMVAAAGVPTQPSEHTP